ncbi:hypothetical protein [Streptomyces rubradiris]|uniref:hypothetical protein n=1 Tax=Streptomyces rubradiris TaxID=285531 RepID=UPI0016785EB0|nr:hypothetical protein [Streptomyces rubradiris]GHH25640.1 hypothetical protein GCM10018792_64870 [Streptomyces rubradiris]
MRTLTAHMPDGRRIVVTHHAADTRQARGRIEWLTTRAYDADGKQYARLAQQYSGRNLAKCRAELAQILADMHKTAHRVDDVTAARAEDVERALAAVGFEPARVGERRAVLDDPEPLTGGQYVITHGTPERPHALVLHAVGHAPFSELAAITGVLHRAGYATEAADGYHFAVIVRSASPAELEERERYAAARVAPLVAAVLPGRSAPRPGRRTSASAAQGAALF